MVFVAKTLGDMVASENRCEQTQIVTLGRIESRRIAAVDFLGFGKLGQFTIGRCRIGYGS